jgi:hypothetical protein
MGMVQQPVHVGGGQGLGHQLVEAGRVEVGANGHTAALVGGVDQAVEALGGLDADREQPNVVDHDQVGPQNPPHHLDHRVVGPAAMHHRSRGVVVHVEGQLCQQLIVGSDDPEGTAEVT